MGEKAAMKWLRKRGYMIRDLNWRDGRYELDIVAEKLYVTHFIEVKTRKADGFTTPEEAMNQNKIDSMIRATRAYIATHNLQNDFQFDLIAVDAMPNGELNIRLVENVIDIRW